MGALIANICNDDIVDRCATVSSILCGKVSLSVMAMMTLYVITMSSPHQRPQGRPELNPGDECRLLSTLRYSCLYASEKVSPPDHVSHPRSGPDFANEGSQKQGSRAVGRQRIVCAYVQDVALFEQCLQYLQHLQCASVFSDQIS